MVNPVDKIVEVMLLILIRIKQSVRMLVLKKIHTTLALLNKLSRWIFIYQIFKIFEYLKSSVSTLFNVIKRTLTLGLGSAMLDGTNTHTFLALIWTHNPKLKEGIYVFFLWPSISLSVANLLLMNWLEFLFLVCHLFAVFFPYELKDYIVWQRSPHCI